MTSRITTSRPDKPWLLSWHSWLAAVPLVLLATSSAWAQNGGGPKLFSAGVLQARDGVVILGRDTNSPCRIVARPGAALRLLDPAGVRVLNPDVPLASRLFFGPTDDCSIGIDPQLPGLVERDPIGFRLLGPNGQGCRLIFGPTMDCTIEVQPPGDNRVPGLLLRDPNGIRILNPRGQLATLRFGATGRCSISAAPDLGMILEDPEGFLFTSDVTVNGDIRANNFPQVSSRRFKQNIRPVEDALAKLQQLQGVYFDWKPEKGGQADVGFIAEDVAQVLPQVVTWDERHEVVQGVKYANVVAVAVEGIKAQQEEITQLKAENAKMRDRLQSLESQFTALATKMRDLANTSAE